MIKILGCILTIAGGTSQLALIILGVDFFFTGIGLLKNTEQTYLITTETFCFARGFVF